MLTHAKRKLMEGLVLQIERERKSGQCFVTKDSSREISFSPWDDDDGEESMTKKKKPYLG